MNLNQLKTGFVPSLEVMPLVEQSMHTEAWQMLPSSGYGRIIRSLLTGELAAGLVPWELFVTELLCKPGQKERWQAPLIIHACPMELFLTPGAMKRIRPALSKKGDPPSARLLYGIEAKRSFTRFQILEWQKSLALPHLEAPTFKVLPMELMLKGLKAGVIDGVVAPTPWGMQAEVNGSGIINSDFKTGIYEQEVVLVCLRDAVDSHKEMLSALPERLSQSHKKLTKEDPFLRVAKYMAGLGAPRFEPELLWKAAQLHLKGTVQSDFIPNAKWLHTELELLLNRGMLGDASADLEKLAQKLEMPPAAATKASLRKDVLVAPLPPSQAG